MTDIFDYVDALNVKLHGEDMFIANRYIIYDKEVVLEIVIGEERDMYSSLEFIIGKGWKCEYSWLDTYNENRHVAKFIIDFNKIILNMRKYYLKELVE